MKSNFAFTPVRIALVAFVVLGIGAAVVVASTTVTVTKTESFQAATSFYDGDTRVQVGVSDMGNDEYYLYVLVYDYSTYTILERWYGYISADDVTVGSGSLVLNTDTTDYDPLYPAYVIGDGGPIVLEWSVAPGDSTSSDQKSTYRTAAFKQISFGGYETSQATVEGTVFGEDYVSAGTMQSSYGKQIIQMFD